MVEKSELGNHVPESCRYLLHKSEKELRSAIPELARDWSKMVDIENAVKDIPSNHSFHCLDSRELYNGPPYRSESCSPILNQLIHLVITSPPYFHIKDYEGHEGQLGEIDEYQRFCDELRKIWEACYDILIPGGRMCVVTGDILQSRRQNGRHRALPLHSTIQEQCREIGFDCFAPIIWYKIGNASLEAGENARFLGKPYEPGANIKNDIEYILLFRKPGDYRSPSYSERILSTLQVDYHRKCYQQIWTDIQGKNTREHPAPYPYELSERLVSMFSFVGDKVLDPFAGIGTTARAAAHNGRNSVNIEVNAEYIKIAKNKLEESLEEEKKTTYITNF